ncbi:lytic transglycosylase domain-containing protein [Methylocapsa polymorpha]|uniref:Lytic transglycosylase domain-containing protein n=1 Tax=Methylocapsa polymorpha TaxID=3080828 RepID=A0ABZ0HP07_9HYPH|nr:lytic transglycosylase domain-containing protein [Methylocapsa sp. RX1]
MVERIADPFSAIVAEASLRFAVPARWIRAVMRTESQNDLHAVSPKGAMGLMQIMPSTWTLLRARLRLGDNPFDPHDNILAGAAFLRDLHDRYGSPGFLAAYNAGPGRYEDYLATGRPLPAETRDYVAALAPVIDDGWGDNSVPVVSAAGSWTKAPLFIGLDQGIQTVDQALLPLRPNRPSNGRRVVDVSALAPLSDGLFVLVSAREPVQ